MFLHQPCESVQVSRASMGSERAPCRRRSPRGFDRGINVRRRALRDRGEFLAIRRIDGVEVFSCGRCLPSATDEMLETKTVTLEPRCCFFGIFWRGAVFHAHEFFNNAHRLWLIRVGSIPSADSAAIDSTPLSLLRVGSNLAILEQQHMGRIGGEGSYVCRCGLPLRTGERFLDGRHIVEVQRRDQMEIRRPGGSHNWTLADLILPKTGNFLCNGNMRDVVMFVEGGSILRIFSDHHKSSHCILLGCLFFSANSLIERTETPSPPGKLSILRAYAIGCRYPAEYRPVA